MTHVRPPVTWSGPFTFKAARKVGDKLVIDLADGTSRSMNYENWDGTVDKTEEKVFALAAGTSIEVGTWKSFDTTKWFCDVRPTS